MGFFALLFNPSAWAAVGGSLLIGFFSGIYIEAKLSNEAVWRAKALAYQQAAEKGQAIQAVDNIQAAIDSSNAEAANTQFKEMLSSNENANPSVCNFTESQLNSLRQLIDASDGSGRLKLPKPAQGHS